jgi:glycine cleavage system transcriptional repressor
MPGKERPAPNDARGGIDVSKRYVLCLTAANRTGILAAVTRALSELGADIDEVSQAVVKNFFAIILAADFPDHRDEHVIVGHLEGVCRQFGVKVFLHDADRETEPGETREAGEKYILTLTGGDAPGIVATISGRLALEGIDIIDLRGARRDDGKSFALLLELTIPARVDPELLQADLERLGGTLGLSARLTRAADSASTTFG